MKKTEAEVRSATIEEFANKLKRGLGGCTLITDESWVSGFKANDIYKLIDAITTEMEGDYNG